MAFTATLAAGIVSIVWSGNLADRRGPRPPLLLGLALFAPGLVGRGPRADDGRPRRRAGRAGPRGRHDEHRALRPRDARLPAAPAHGDPRRLLGGMGRALDRGTVRRRSHRADDRLALGLRPRARRPRRRRRAARQDHHRAAAGRRRRAVAPRLDRRLGRARRRRARGSTLSPTGSTRSASPSPWSPSSSWLSPCCRSRRAARCAPRAGCPPTSRCAALAFAAFSGAEVYLPRLLTERDGLSPEPRRHRPHRHRRDWFAGSWVQGRWDHPSRSAARPRCRSRRSR